MRLNKNEIMLPINDGANVKDHVKVLRGEIKIFDEWDNCVIEKDNLVVLRGRTFVLESLFNESLDTAVSGYKNNLNRVPCLFKIGCGGADVTSNPADPFVPVYDDEDLTQPVPFVIQDPNKFLDTTKAANPSIIDTMTATDQATYYLPITRSTGETEYYGKIFETSPQWVFNKSTNEVYKKVVLRVEASEARGYDVNELGIVLAEYVSATNSHADAELMTRVTFPTIFLNTPSRYFTVEYNIYA